MKMPKIKISRTFTVVYCIILLMGFIYGMTAVSVNCYNSMNSEPMIVFEMNEDSVIIMNRIFNRLF